jgi:hypothetical protein
MMGQALPNTPPRAVIRYWPGREQPYTCWVDGYVHRFCYSAPEARAYVVAELRRRGV